MLHNRLLPLACLLALVTTLHVCMAVRSEPFFNNDETRHVMTGVFFRDLFHDGAFAEPKEYAGRYYVQYPALGLLTWPPLFYAIEGAWMSLFGTGFIVAQVLVGVFAGIALTYFFLLVARTHDVRLAWAAALALGVSPLFVTYARQVMLEMPTLAFGLAATYYFVRYLDEGSRACVWLAALAAAAAALTRYDAVYLLPLFGLLLAVRRRWDVFRRPSLWLALLVAVGLVTPWYFLALKECGTLPFKVGESDSTGVNGGLLSLANLLFYVRCVPEQLGWILFVAALVGLVACFERQRLQVSVPYLAMIAATFLTLAPYSEQEPRHTIYALPGFAFLAASGLRQLALLFQARKLEMLLTGGALAGTVAFGLQTPPLYVRGYEDAARYVVAESKGSERCLFDNFLNGSFIYHTRHADPERRIWVLRGDKLLYSVQSDPRFGYTEHVADDGGILALIDKFDPAFIVTEEPQIGHPLPMAERLREVLRQHPERFQMEKEFPVESNYRLFAGVTLKVYRNLVRTPQPTGPLEMEMWNLGGRRLQAELPR